MAEFLQGYDIVNYAFYYHGNGFNHPLLPISTTNEPKKVQGAIWGLVPGWIKTSPEAKEWADKTLNAKSETIFDLVSFKNYIGKNRCLIWVKGFYEWQWLDKGGKNKIPHFIYVKEKTPFTMGGVFSEWARPDTGEIFHTVAIITTPANPLIETIHNSKKRMPFIVQPQDRERWLGNLNKDEINHMMKPCPNDVLTSHTISKLITSRNENPNVPEVQDEYKYEGTL